MQKEKTEWIMSWTQIFENRAPQFLCCGDVKSLAVWQSRCRWWCWNTLLVGRASNWPVQLKQIAHAHFLCCFLFNYLNGIKMDMFYIFSIHLSLRSKWFQQLNDIWYVAPSHYDIKLIFLDGDEMHWARLALVTGRPSIAVLMGMAIN